MVNWIGAKLFAQVSAVGDRAASSDMSGIAAQISVPGLLIGLSARGHILRMKLGATQIPVPVRLCTVLADCHAEGVVTRRDLDGGGVEFSCNYIRDPTGERCHVTERFTPGPTSVRWELEILGEGEPWTTTIGTQMAWLDAREACFWTAWSQPCEGLDHWADPLGFATFSNRTFKYGSSATGSSEGMDSFAVPIVTVGEPRRDIALSLIQSPEDTLLDMELDTTNLGDAIVSRLNHRISNQRPVRFAIDLVAHPADWRAGLGWMSARYPHFFEPENRRTYELDGCGAYSGYSGKLDVQSLANMAFTVNWNASFEWPFLGINIPLVNPGVDWESWYQKKTSIATMQEFDKRIASQGFHVLEYFNTTEAGNYIQEVAPPRKAVSDSDLWRDPNDFIHYQIPAAVLRDGDGKIHYSNWFNNVVVDPADPTWASILVAQAKHMVLMLPQSDGICIDRMDWLEIYNPHRDDGVSWRGGKAARSFIVSWKQILAKLAPIFHDANKCIFVNCLTRRADTLEHIDGLFTEEGDSPCVLNLVGVMGSQRPVIAWTDNIDSLRPNPDAYFQRHLHLGVFPMVPYPDADHSIAPDPWVNAQYLDYGCMFHAIRGKRWVLRANAVFCAGSKAKVNLFDIPGGVALSVTFGSEDSADVLFEVPPEISADDYAVQVLHPEATEWVELNKTVASNHNLRVQVPLKRNCALVRAVYAWMEPDIAVLTSDGEMQIHCSISNATIRYTLDGTEPAAASAIYRGPIKIAGTAEVKAAIFVSGKQIGRSLFNQAYVL